MPDQVPPPEELARCLGAVQEAAGDRPFALILVMDLGPKNFGLGVFTAHGISPTLTGEMLALLDIQRRKVTHTILETMAPKDRAIALTIATLIAENTSPEFGEVFARSVHHSNEGEPA